MISEEEMAFRLILALVFGALIGLEREIHKNTAGLRTHMLVCMSSGLLMVISVSVAEDMGVIGDPMRLAAGVITGIGFLGAGTIIKHGATVQGLTTAASIWTSAAVGLAVGVGYYTSSLLVVLLTLFTLYIVHAVDRNLRVMRRRSRALVTIDYQPGAVDSIDSLLQRLGVETGEFTVKPLEGPKGRMLFEVHLVDLGVLLPSEVADALLALEPVVGVEFF